MNTERFVTSIKKVRFHTCARMAVKITGVSRVKSSVVLIITIYNWQSFKWLVLVMAIWSTAYNSLYLSTFALASLVSCLKTYNQMTQSVTFRHNTTVGTLPSDSKSSSIAPETSSCDPFWKTSSGRRSVIFINPSACYNKLTYNCYCRR